MDFLKRQQSTVPPPPNYHLFFFFGGGDKLCFWEFWARKFLYRWKTLWGKPDLGPSQLVDYTYSLALLGHQFWFWPIWGIFRVSFWAQIWPYRTCAAKMTILGGICNFTLWNCFGELNRSYYSKQIYRQYNNIKKMIEVLKTEKSFFLKENNF